MAFLFHGVTISGCTPLRPHIDRSRSAIAHGCGRKLGAGKKQPAPGKIKRKRVMIVTEKKQVLLVPTDKDLEVIKLMRQTDYGKVLVTVKNGEPVHAEIQKSIPIK